MTPIKTLEDYHKEENIYRIFCYEWCRYHKDWHPLAAFRIRKGTRHGRMECRLIDNERRRNYFKIQQERIKRNKKSMDKRSYSGMTEGEQEVQRFICGQGAN